MSGKSASGGTVFALAGGGNLGASQVGMLYALLEAGITPDAVVGTSVGALNGAFLVGHCDLEGVEELADLWASLRRRDVFPISVRDIARGIVGRRNHLFEPIALRTVIARANLGFSKLEDAVIPLQVVATDLATGEVAVLSKGSVADALLASSAIPGLYPPVEIGDRMLVDGGLVANVPVREAEALGASSIFVLPTVPKDIEAMPSNAPAMMQRAMLLAARPAARASLVDVASRTTVKVLPAPESAGQLSIFDFHSTSRLIDEGYELARTWLAGDAWSGRRLGHAEAETQARANEQSEAGAERGARLVVA